MSYKECGIINEIDNYFDDDPNKSGEYYSMNILNTYCPGSNCSSDKEKIISGFIMLLNMLNDEYLESDKIVEYASLWLSHKLNQKKENGITKLYDFYANNIETNSLYTGNISNNSDDHINIGVIDKKIKSMDIDIKDISNFYDALKSLCNMHSEINVDNYQCNNCLENAGEFFEKCEKVKNIFDITKGSSYLQLWISLSNDYKNFESNYNSHFCTNGPPLVTCSRSSVTKNTLISIAIIFVAASILLGVSYKYSLFGFRKRSQKQQLREMLKK
ncbi:PIR protein [Plasmodium yoelii]|uniref:PIR protein n=2 Tax=Plasmodium yoelii TaxID=5861 RepID=A0AAE9WT97_PLAYO|nr:PIR protein [Plasmodium yoelii]XP_034493607.1 PIR protein [Plasmodium yoelii]WBY59605.1 PIR protein [Plasmodium yoelii yoelii]WBY59633.1 PIR protein [Plasmodium yoelii yoelii]VTZ80347.1 PIR protein [Plasmodium yoelii]VTZ80373.1 PIR protein [Plasmodium yoelii]|eukprot:XP_034493595.1 PIR protein [Plasmodium yoelii]